MKKILISGCYHSMNSGVMAMAETIVQQFPESYVYIFSSPEYYENDSLRYSIYENVQLVQIPWLNGELKNKLKLLLAYFGISLYTNVNKIMNDVDIIVDISGDSISNDYGTRSIFFSILPVFLKKKKIPYIFGPQTIGPFDKGLQKHLVEKAFKKAHSIYLRESESLNKIKDNNIRVERVVSDLAFLLKPSDSLPIEFELKNDTIAIGVSSLIKKFGKENSIQMFRDVCENCLKKGYDVLLVNHVSTIQGNDIQIAKEIKESYFNSDDRVIFLNRNFRASEWKNIIKMCKAIISARMHPVVGALSMGVPALNLSYNHKSIGVVYNRFFPFGDVVDVLSNELMEKVHLFLNDLPKFDQNEFDQKVKDNKLLAEEFFKDLNKL